MSNHYDVIVVGLGAMGSATLYQLAKRGVKALGIDQFEPPHTLGSTHGESRVTRLAVGEGPEYIPLVRRTHEIWRELEAATGTPLLHETGGYIFCPKDSGADWHGDGDFVESTAAIAREFNIPVERLSPQQVRERHPMLQIQDNFHALHEPSAGIVDPERAVTAQLNEAKRLGATVQTGERMLSYSAESQAVTIQTDKGNYSADKIVLATGAWMEGLMPDKLKQPFGVYRQTMFWFEAEDIEQFSGETFPWVLWIGETLEDYYGVFPITIGSRPYVKMLTEELLTRTDIDSVNRVVSSAEREHMANHFVKRKLNGVTTNCIDAAVCLYTITPDEHFVIDWHPDSERVLIASPCSGHGFKHSAAIGESIAQWVAEGKSQIDLGSFNLARFD